MGFSLGDELLNALSKVFGLVTDGHVRVGEIMFSGDTNPADKATVPGSPAAATKPLSMGRMLVEHVLIKNSEVDDRANATAGNQIVIGNETEQVYTVAQGGAIELDWVDLSKIRVCYMPADLTAGQKVMVRWIAHGRRMS
jgi:hypothetical protein